MEEILTLDQIVTKFVKDESNQEYIEFLEQKIMPIFEKILSKQPQKLEKRNWSRKVNINESIENVYQFLKQEICSNYANQFINIIRQERYGNVKVEILPKSEYKDDVLYVNGEKVDEPYLTQKIKEAKESGTAPFTPDFNIEYLSSTKSKTVPEGMYFVMGDNRQHSTDSRVFGFVKKEAMIGKVSLRYYPFSSFKFF